MPNRSGCRAIAKRALRVFSQFEEDGIILFMLATAGIGSARFAEIGAGDGIHASNCANLAFNLGFHGLFVEGDEESVERGRSVYGSHDDTSFLHARTSSTC